MLWDWNLASVPIGQGFLPNEPLDAIFDILGWIGEHGFTLVDKGGIPMRLVAWELGSVK